MQKKDHLSPELLNSLTDRGRSVPTDELLERLRAGWRCVRFEGCYSFLLGTVVRRSTVYLTPNWQSRCWRGFGYTATTFLLGPWGIPWGPVWTVRSAWTNLTGGVDVTTEVLALVEANTSHPPG